MPNRLSQEKSPYLLQHAENPVDWYPWGEAAFQKAREEDKPVFLSIGYATCHWCHVMERESFEDEEVAGVLNSRFVAVKVDREERPDVDHIYMTVCQALRGSGGWPLSVFMTPEKKPFFAGSYFPKRSRLGMPGFLDILLQLDHLWRHDRPRLVQVSEQITDAIQPRTASSHGQVLDETVLRKAHEQLKAIFDDRWGGFGKAPKFPTPHHLTFLLRWFHRRGDPEALRMVEKTLLAMRYGGIFDQVGLGFHRYSVDERWLVPHFEKMLYDQAMLAMAYTEAFQVTGDNAYARVAGEVFDYVLRDMTDGDGAFYSAEDADSEGREGLFYVWTPDQVKGILGEDLGDLYCRFHGISAEGNFEDRRSIPHISNPLSAFAESLGRDAAELERLLSDARQRLFHAREGRIHPLKDDKVLTAWNGLMIAALAKGYQALRREEYLKAACRAADFILSALRDGSGRLCRRFRQGQVAHPGYADDYAFLIWGLIELYEAALRVQYLNDAVRLQRTMFDLFWDDETGGFFYTPHDGESLILRDKEIYDGAVPSSNSVAALNLLRLARMTGNTEWEGRVDRLFRNFSSLVADYPAAYTQFLNAVDFALGPGMEVVIAGRRGDGGGEGMIEAVQRRFIPGRVLLLHDEEGDGLMLRQLAPFVADHHCIGGGSVAYVCRNYRCLKPVTSVPELEGLLGGLPDKY